MFGPFGKLPFWPTLIVASAVAVMIALGIWQLQRMQWKDGLLARYEQAADRPAISWPAVPTEADAPLFRKSAVNCLEVIGWRATSGRSAGSRAGWAHIASCRTGGGEGPGAQVVAGWSASPETPEWDGGMVEGTIAPDSRHVIRLVAAEPVAGLARPQPPSPADIPNNHFAYAVQWFLFAAAALVIYWLALGRRRRG